MHDIVILFPASNYFTVEPESDDTILAMNQMINATFQCKCTVGDYCTSPPFWSLENGGRYLTTFDDDDAIILAERGITYSSSGTSAVLSIPATAKNNNTLISCAGFIFGGIEFSDPQVKLIIIGKSNINRMFVASGTCRGLKQVVERTKFKLCNSTAIMLFHLASNYSLNS